MRLEVAFDFADHPRPYHSLACPADTKGELYRALKVLAAEARRLSGAQQAAEVCARDQLTEAECDSIYHDVTRANLRRDVKSAERMRQIVRGTNRSAT